jgi:serine phosphatase RsbU (regulator of sigma subunit)/PAS domain-containing protein
MTRGGDAERGAGLTGLRSRSAALREAAGLPDADLRALLAAALDEVDAATAALSSRLGPDGGPADEHGSATAHSERRQLQAMFRQLPVPLFLLDLDGTVRRANSAVGSLLGSGSGYATGKVFTALIEPPARAAVQSQLAAAERTGEVRELTCGMLGTGGPVACRLQISRVGVRGEPDQLAVAVSRLPELPGSGAVGRGKADSPAENGPALAEEPWSALAEGPGSALAAMMQRSDLTAAVTGLLLDSIAMTEPAILRRCGQLLAERLSAWVIIDLEQPAALRRQVVVPPEELRSADLARAVAALDPAGSAAGQVHSSGSSLLIAHAEEPWLLGSDPDGKPVLTLIGATSLLVVPIRDGGRSYGALTLARGAAAEPFGLADAGIIEQVGENLGRALRARDTVRRRTEAAEALQQGLIPRSLRAIPGVDVGAEHLAPTEGAPVGGDFYDVFPVPGGLGIAIGEVSGKDGEAVGVTAAARHAIRVLAHFDPRPAAVLRGANKIILAEDLSGEFVTGHVGVLSWQAGLLQVDLASAGQPGPVLVSADGAIQPWEGGGVPLGIFPDAEPATREFRLATGDLLFFYTAGLTSASNGEREHFGNRFLDDLAVLAGQDAADVVAGLRRAVLEFSEGVLRDDIAMLALRVGEAPEDAA